MAVTRGRACEGRRWSRSTCIARPGRRGRSPSSPAAAAARRFAGRRPPRPFASRLSRPLHRDSAVVIPMLAAARRLGRRSRRASSSISRSPRLPADMQPADDLAARRDAARHRRSPPTARPPSAPMPPCSAAGDDLRLLANASPTGRFSSSASRSAALGGSPGRIAASRRASAPATASRRVVKVVLIACSAVAVLTTVGIVFSVLFETLRFFARYPVLRFPVRPAMVAADRDPRGPGRPVGRLRRRAALRRHDR